MNYRYLGFGVGFTALLSMAQGQVAAQAESAITKAVKQTWTAPRTADGHPDLQGVWANNIATNWFQQEKPRACRSAFVSSTAR